MFKLILYSIEWLEQLFEIINMDNELLFLVVIWNCLISFCCLLSESHMFIPTFVDLTSKDIDENRKKLMDANVQYPIGKCFYSLKRGAVCLSASITNKPFCKWTQYLVSSGRQMTLSVYDICGAEMKIIMTLFL